MQRFAEMIEKQNEIIKMQSDLIDELFKSLAQYICIEKEEGKEMIEKIGDVAEMRKQVE